MTYNKAFHTGRPRGEWVTKGRQKQQQGDLEFLIDRSATPIPQAGEAGSGSNDD